MTAQEPAPSSRSRVAKILATVLLPGQESVPLADRLCAECVRTLDISGAAIILMNDVDNLGVVAVTDGPAAQMEELQFATGEGPCVDASRTGSPVLLPDVRGAVQRWPGYGSGLLNTSIQAIFAFPLQVGAIRIGVLDLYRGTEGGLTKTHFVEALAFADAAALLLLHLQGDPNGGPATPTFDPIGRNAAIHQATGMIAVQLRVGLADALLRLRAHAYSSDVSMAAVAADVVSRKLRFDHTIAGTSPPETR